ncbi:hypothetical protein ACTA71_005901 [Dictyostelium dimigraforme]
MSRIVKPPTQEEMRDIGSLLSSGEPYEILGCTPDSTNKEVTKKYRDLARKHHPDKQQHNGNQSNDGGDMMTKVNNAYKILSNERFRDIYNVYLYPEIMKEEGDNIFGEGGVSFNGDRVNQRAKINNIIMATMGILLDVIAIPFRTIGLVVQSNPLVTKSTTACISMVKEHGFFRGLYRGTTFFMLTSVLEIIREKSVDVSFAAITNNSNSRKVQYLKSFVNTITKSIVNFPIRLIGNIFIISSHEYSEINVLKDVILRYGQATTGNIIMSAQTNRAPSIQWKNLFYSIGYSLAIAYTKKLVLIGMEKISLQIYQRSIENPNNKIYRFSNYLLSNNLFRVALQTIIVNPLDVLHSQYPKTLLESWMDDGKPVPIAQDPISLAINIYRLNNNSITKFFNGFFPLFCCRLLEDISEQFDQFEENYDHEDI